MLKSRSMKKKVTMKNITNEELLNINGGLSLFYSLITDKDLKYVDAKY